MVALAYVGKTPDTDSALVPKNFADTLNASLTPTTTQINNTLIAPAAALLTIKSYVDSSNALLAQQSAVTAADNTFLAANTLNAANGVAGLTSAGNLITGQQPTSGVILDRVAQCYSVGAASGAAGILGGVVNTVTNASGLILVNGSATVTSGASPRGTQLASLPIPDPGWPWVPLCFGLVQGDSSGGATPSYRQQGNSDMGLVTVLPSLSATNAPTGQPYGIALCTDSIKTNTYPILPFAAPSQTPATITPITGALELDVWGTCFTGTSYTFYEANFSFFVLVTPSM